MSVSEKEKQHFLQKYENIPDDNGVPFNTSQSARELKLCFPELIQYRDVVEKYPHLMNGKTLDDINWPLLHEQISRIRGKYNLHHFTVRAFVYLEVQQLLLEQSIDYSLWGNIFCYFDIYTKDNYCKTDDDGLILYDANILYDFKRYHILPTFTITKVLLPIILLAPESSRFGPVKLYYKNWIESVGWMLIDYPSITDVIKRDIILHVNGYSLVELQNANTLSQLLEVINTLDGTFSSNSAKVKVAETHEQVPALTCGDKTSTTCHKDVNRAFFGRITCPTKTQIRIFEERYRNMKLDTGVLLEESIVYQNLVKHVPFVVTHEKVSRFYTVLIQNTTHSDINWYVLNNAFKRFNFRLNVNNSYIFFEFIKQFQGIMRQYCVPYTLWGHILLYYLKPNPYISLPLDMKEYEQVLVHILCNCNFKNYHMEIQKRLLVPPSFADGYFAYRYYLEWNHTAVTYGKYNQYPDVYEGINQHMRQHLDSHSIKYYNANTFSDLLKFLGVSSLRHKKNKDMVELVADLVEYVKCCPILTRKDGLEKVKHSRKERSGSYFENLQNYFPNLVFSKTIGDRVSTSDEKHTPDAIDWNSFLAEVKTILWDCVFDAPDTTLLSFLRFQDVCIKLKISYELWGTLFSHFVCPRSAIASLDYDEIIRSTIPEDKFDDICSDIFWFNMYSAPPEIQEGTGIPHYYWGWESCLHESFLRYPYLIEAFKLHMKRHLPDYAKVLDTVQTHHQLKDIINKLKGKFSSVVSIPHTSYTLCDDFPCVLGLTKHRILFQHEVSFETRTTFVAKHQNIQYCPNIFSESVGLFRKHLVRVTDIITHEKVLVSYPLLIQNTQFADLDFQLLTTILGQETFVLDGATDSTILDVILTIQKVLHSYCVDYSLWGEILIKCITLEGLESIPVDLRSYDGVVSYLLKDVDLYLLTVKREFEKLSHMIYSIKGSVFPFYTHWIGVVERITDLLDTEWDSWFYFDLMRYHMKLNWDEYEHQLKSPPTKMCHLKRLVYREKLFPNILHEKDMWIFRHDDLTNILSHHRNMLEQRIETLKVLSAATRKEKGRLTKC